MVEGKPYQNEQWLRERYYGEGNTLQEIANECGVTGTTIGDWMDRFGLERRDQQEAQKPDKPYTNEEWLRKEYIDNGRSMADIGDECGVSAAVILKWLRRFNVDTRHSAEHKLSDPISIKYSGGELGDLPGPYVQVQSSVTVDGEREFDRVYIHQLIAISEGADPHKVFSDGEYHCHHKDGIRWHNRPQNIEFTTGEKHLREHSKDRVRMDTGEWE